MFVELRAMLARRKFRLDELNDRVLRKVQGTVLNSMELYKYFPIFLVFLSLVVAKSVDKICMMQPVDYRLGTKCRLRTNIILFRVKPRNVIIIYNLPNLLPIIEQSLVLFADW